MAPNDRIPAALTCVSYQHQPQPVGGLDQKFTSAANKTQGTYSRKDGRERQGKGVEGEALVGGGDAASRGEGHQQAGEGVSTSREGAEPEAGGGVGEPASRGEVEDGRLAR